jgi:cysteinyl-tRNA synthetase
MHGYFLQIDEAKMAKSKGDFLRLQLLIDKGYDPLAYRFFALSALYRAKLNFTWDALDSAAKSFNRLRNLVYSWGEAGKPDEDFVAQFTDQVNDDINMPRAVAVAWELARSDLSDATKKATILEFDRVLGLDLGSWKPPEVEVPLEILELVEQRTQMRSEKRWAEADNLRSQVAQAGYEIEDTPQGSKVKKIKSQELPA